MTPPNPIQAVLLDLDGTLYTENHWIQGAQESIDWLRDNKLKIRFITNTTMRNRSQLQERFIQMGVDAPLDWFFTPARCGYRWLKQQNYKNGILALVHPNLKQDLEGLRLVESETADAVLIGDMAEAWQVPLLNKALRCLQKGGDILALQMNRFWLDRDGACLDAGAFVAALSYASQKKCEKVFGKPNPVFFQMALDDLKVEASNAMMVGDDIDSDVLAAQDQGLQGVLVKTGKFQRQPNPEKLDQVHHVITSIADLPKVLASLI